MPLDNCYCFAASDGSILIAHLPSASRFSSSFVIMNHAHAGPIHSGVVGFDIILIGHIGLIFVIFLILRNYLAANNTM